MGGLIALEMAALLRRKRRKVARLVMIDTYHPSLIRQTRELDYSLLDPLARQVVLANSEAARTCRPARYKGPVDLIRASRRGDKARPPVQLGWRGVLAGPLNVTTIDGDHRSIVLGEDASALAEILDGLCSL